MNYPELARMQNADALPNNDNSIAESSALSYIMQINFNWFALCIPYAAAASFSILLLLLFLLRHCCSSCRVVVAAVVVAAVVVVVVRLVVVVVALQL